MYLRRHRKTVGKDAYDYWTLCESIRTEKGPRQRVVASLGKLTDREAGPEVGWDELEALLEGRSPSPRQTRLGEKPAEPEQSPRWEVAHLGALRVENVRDFGEVWLGLSLWHRLGLGKLLAEVLEPGKEDVPWHQVAAVLTVARFCAQRSELGVAEHWYERTALAELTGIPLEKINDDRLYRGLDVLATHKEQLCSHLQKRYRDWFGVQFEFLLYDVTSTYFEGQGLANTKAARGYSRDQRGDCKQVCIGLVCTPEGLPLSFEVFAGNRTDVTTVEEIVTSMESKYGQAERIWVMDRGMVSEKNLEFLRGRKARYLVGTPKSQLKGVAKVLLEKEGWHQVQNGVEARLLPHPDGHEDEQFVLCRSQARAEKERAMLGRQTQRLCEELMQVAASLNRQPEMNREKLGRRIGRWLGKYPAAAAVMEVAVEYDDKGAAVDLILSSRVDPGQWKERVHGAYLLRTNCTETDPAQLWCERRFENGVKRAV